MEKALDVAVETGDLDKAATISDNIATREFASKIATAFDCVDYVKRKKVCMSLHACMTVKQHVADGERKEEARQAQVEVSWYNCAADNNIVVFSALNKRNVGRLKGTCDMAAMHMCEMCSGHMWPWGHPLVMCTVQLRAADEMGVVIARGGVNK